MNSSQRVDGYYKDRSSGWQSRDLHQNWRKSAPGPEKSQELSWRRQDGQQDQQQDKIINVAQSWRWQHRNRQDQQQYKSVVLHQNCRKSTPDLRISQNLTWRHHQDDRQDNQQYSHTVQVTSYHLVECLAESPTFSANILQLEEKMNTQSKNIVGVASQYSKLFRSNGKMLELKPQIDICKAYFGPEGCSNWSSCSQLHICPKYVLRWCKISNCALGHKWSTDHNICVLKSFCLENLSFPTLRKIVQSVSQHQFSDIGKLDVCSGYNSGGCNQSNCEALHVCLNYITGLTKCSHVDCPLNHNLLSPGCFQLLRLHSLPTNETPRDIVMALLTSNVTLARLQLSEGREHQTVSAETIKNDKIINYVDHNSLQKDRNTSKNDSALKEAEENKNNYVDSSNNKHSIVNNSENYIISPISNENFGSKDSIPAEENTSIASVKNTSLQPEPLITVWSHYLEGDVPVPEICFNSVEGTCKHEESGCQRLHSKQHYHWQFREHGDHWINLHLNQVIFLEQSFCDPAQDDVDLPRLDPSTHVRGPLILMVQETWRAHFKDMMLTNSSNNKTLELRRLCTEPVSGQMIQAAHFIWYFFDKNKKWVNYGNADTSGSINLISSITSDDIENHFQQKKTQPLIFSNSRYTYFLNLNTMKQSNLKTNMIRDVKRRPASHLLSKKTVMKEQTNPGELPSNWEVMQPDELYKLVSLESSSAEYQTIVGLLKGRISSSAVQRIQRIQNPYLWFAFTNKIKEMTAIYKDSSTVNVQHLFHGTGHDIVTKICVQNFDWRLHGSSSGQAFGRGTYFSTDAVYSCKYCRPDALGMKYLFVARTAVGTTIRGNSAMVRPPLNTDTGQPYDSTTNRSPNPSIIVKYDKQEYYPEYIIALL